VFGESDPVRRRAAIAGQGRRRPFSPGGCIFHNLQLSRDLSRARNSPKKRKILFKFQRPFLETEYVSSNPAKAASQCSLQRISFFSIGNARQSRVFNTFKILCVATSLTLGPDIADSLHATKEKFPFFGDSIWRLKNKVTAMWVVSVWLR